jgi:hypothetical protein
MFSKTGVVKRQLQSKWNFENTTEINRWFYESDYCSYLGAWSAKLHKKYLFSKLSGIN